MKAIIIGAGIGGLTAALTLEKIGWDVNIFEAVADIQPLGVGINLLPHGASVLHRLGLGEQLDQLAIKTSAIEYRTRFGQLITSDARGVEAGHDYPQYSVHRGQLQQLLLTAVRERLGADAVRSGHRCVSFRQHSNRAEALFEGTNIVAEGDILIGADGFHSAIRKQLHPNEGPASYEGMMMWRGMRKQAAFGDGKTMFIAGNHNVKLVCYPVSEQARIKGSALINWVAEVRNCSPREAGTVDWTRAGTRDFIASFNEFTMPDINVIDMLKNTDSITQYPMIDREPLDWWTDGRVTLLGDAAHPMYPIGANGASQAVVDCQALADALQSQPDACAALHDYESERRIKTSEVVLANRQSGPEQVLDLADERVSSPDDRIEDLISTTEIETIAARYRAVAGFLKHTEA